MSTEALIGIVGVSLLAVGNIVIVAFKTGRLSQKVDDVGARVTRLENAVNGWLSGNPGKEDKK